jgi:predicted metal-dependent hydrolase
MTNLVSFHNMLTNFDLPSHIALKRSRRARRLALRLDPQKRIFNLIVPYGVSFTRARKFVGAHEPWMREKLARLPASIPFAHGAVIPLMGREIRIKVSSDKTLKRTGITLNENELFVSTHLEDPTARIRRFLKNLARENLERASREKALLVGKTVKSVQVRDTKSRWGSCSHDERLSFSWRLIFAPPAVMDGVVAHEVAHMVHLDHSKDFWRLCRELSEDFIEARYWLRNHGSELMRYG